MQIGQEKVEKLTLSSRESEPEEQPPLFRSSTAMVMRGRAWRQSPWDGLTLPYAGDRDFNLLLRC